ncbi:MAG: hypothetical protein OXN17_20845 [Candidatus Poribacteria bacterium]|nr:hypothetical protein [Candidatus Poribacteria bacterium]MDE0506543.1 hypothetical protein [Candidatus Poribacteria bacterium]
MDNYVLNGIIGFFEVDVLSYYENNPHKYELDADDFEGVLKTTDPHYYKLESCGMLNEDFTQIRFGYHSRKDGTLCIAVYLPDLDKVSETERAKWFAFRVEKSLLSTDDERFKKWHDRYIKGSFDVESGPRKRLARIIEKINACCKTLVSESLYTTVPDQSVRYPSSQNTHAYEDAHENLYGFLIDSLSKDCLVALANLRKKTILNPQNMKSTTLLRHVFTEFDKHSKLHAVLSTISQQRGRASHGVRPAAREFDAFGAFYRDLEDTTEAYEELLGLIESAFSVSAIHELERYEIMNRLPKIDKNKSIESHYSICEATRMEGKTIEKVWFGMREDMKGVHQSEVLYLKFTDGEVLAMETGSNASDLQRNSAMKPDDIAVDFLLTWVPVPSNN